MNIGNISVEGKVIDSVTRFGEISPLWQILLSLWQFFESLFCIWHTSKPILTNFVCHWADFH